MASIQETLQEQLDAMKACSFRELAALPQYQDRDVACSEGRVQLCIWKDALSDHELRIVVQASKNYPLGISTIKADGFRVDREGIQKLTETDRFELS